LGIKERQDAILSRGRIQFDMKTPPSKYCTTPTLRIEYLDDDFLVAVQKWSDGAAAPVM
jgi:hypothetical protein